MVKNMFKPIGTQEAQNEEGVIVEIDAYILRYIHGEHVLEFGSEPGMPTSKIYDALFNVYFPTSQLCWLAPYQGEVIALEKSLKIEKYIKDALHALNCEVNFTTPITS
jgi:hypothetical protein